MFATIPVSELQKSPSKALKQTRGYTYILSNNKKIGFIVDEGMMRFMEEQGVLEEYEDYILMNSTKLQAEKEEGRKIQESKEYSNCISFEELCELP